MIIVLERSERRFKYFVASLPPHRELSYDDLLRNLIAYGISETLEQHPDLEIVTRIIYCAM